MNEDPNKQNAFNLNESVSGQPIFGAPQNNGFSTQTTPITSADTGLSATPTIPNASAAPTTPNASVAPVVSIAPVAPTTSVNPAASITSANTASPATPIMSTPEASMPQTTTPNAQDFTPNTQFASRSTSKFFGGRRRASRIAADANLSNPSQYNNQNAPAFFNQAMQQNDMAAVAQAEERKRKNKILKTVGISIVGVLVIAISAVSIAKVISSNSEAEERTRIENIREDIGKNLDESRVADLEDFFYNTYSEKIDSEGLISKKYDDFFLIDENTMSNLEEYFNSYDTKSLNTSEKDKLKEVNSTISSKKDTYTKLFAGAKLLRGVIKNESQAINDIKKLNSDKLSKIANDIKEAIVISEDSEEKYKTARCYNDETTSVCKTIIEEMDRADDILSDASLVHAFLMEYSGVNSFSEEEMISNKIDDFVTEVEQK